MSTTDTDMEKTPPVASGIFTLPPFDREPPALLGGICPGCQEQYFPRPRYCPRCLGSLQECSIGSRGTIYSFTVVRIKAPLGLPQPYSVGYINMTESGLRVFCLLDPSEIDRLAVGLEVELAVARLGHDGNGEPRLRPYFKLVDREKSGKAGGA